MKSEEVPPQKENERRKKVIKQFEKGVVLYYAHKNEQAIQEFQKVLDQYDDFIDIACKASQYIQFCKG